MPSTHLCAARVSRSLRSGKNRSRISCFTSRPCEVRRNCRFSRFGFRQKTRANRDRRRNRRSILSFKPGRDARARHRAAGARSTIPEGRERVAKPTRDNIGLLNGSGKGLKSVHGRMYRLTCWMDFVSLFEELFVHFRCAAAPPPSVADGPPTHPSTPPLALSPVSTPAHPYVRPTSKRRATPLPLLSTDRRRSKTELRSDAEYRILFSRVNLNLNCGQNYFVNCTYCTYFDSRGFFFLEG